MADQTPQYIRKVALVGGSGNMGAHFLQSLLSTTKHEVTVLARPGNPNNNTFPPGTTVKEVDYSSLEALTSALKGHDFLIITMSANAPKDVHPRIVHAAADAGIKYIMPNYYGYGLPPRSPSAADDPIAGPFEKWITDVRDVAGQGVKFIAVVCGFWYEWSLGLGEALYGFDIPGRKVTFYDDGMKKINTSTWKLCGESVANLLSLPVQRTEGVEGPVLADWDDQGLYISSYLVSQRDMLDSLHRVLGTTDADWEIKYQGVMERYEEGMKELGQGSRAGFAKALYSRIYFPEGRGDYETGWGLDNEKLGVKAEELDVATKRTVEMIEDGFSFQKIFSRA